MSEGAKSVVSLKNVAKSFARGDESIAVLQGLNLEIAEGSFEALMGPSGSGKSTLLNLIAGLDKATSGDVIVAGKNLTTMSDAELASFRASHIGFIFQSYNLMPVLTAVENTLHRDRSDRWGPRTIDLDLLLYDDAVIEQADLTVPHPRMATRRFVLEPCVEIAPDLVHPVAGRSLRSLLANISQPHPHIAVVGVPGSGAPEVAATVADAILARVIHAPAVVPSPKRADFARHWEAALRECAAALQADAWPDDSHGTVTDFWLGTFLAAADGQLPAAEARRTYDRFARTTMPPGVVLLLIAEPATLDERLAFRRRTPAPQTDMFADLVGTATAVADAPPAATADTVAMLITMQDRLRRRLLGAGPVPDDRPPAVVAIRADDLGQAMGDAVAAVEAMA